MSPRFAPPSRFSLRPFLLSVPLLLGSASALVYSATSLRAEPLAHKHYQLAAGSLAGQLNQFAAQSGIYLAGDGALTAGKNSPALEGDYSVEQALMILLNGSGITAVRKGEGRYELQPRAAGTGSLELDATNINGVVQETAFAPVSGYVARRTSTATKTDTDFLENPQAVSVVTRDRIDDLGAQKLDQALSYTSGVRADSGGADNASDNPYLRGYPVSFTYLDGLRLRPLGFFGIFSEEVYGLERIEVLKGPTSVLYGQSEPGGMINTVSKRPTDFDRGEVAIVGGSQDRKQGNFDISGPLTEDHTFLYRFVALVRNADGNVDYTADDRTYIAPSLTWQPSDQTSLTLLASYQKNKALASTNIPWSAVNGDSTYGRVPANRFIGEPGFDRESVEASSFGYQFSHEFNDIWTVRQNARYTDFDNEENYLARASGLHDGLDGSVKTSIDREWQLRNAYGDQLSIDNQAQAKFSTGSVSHTALFGIDYSWSNSVRNEKWGNAPELNVFNPVYGLPVDTSVYTSWFNTQQRNKQLGYYLQDQLKWDKWVLTVGGRQDEASSRTKDRWTGLETSDQNWSAFTGRAGLVYLFDNGLAPFVSYSESFSPVSGTTSPERGGKPYEPETGKQYEAGVRYQSPGTNSQITLSVYDLRKQNSLTPDSNDFNYSVQTGETQSKGVELEAIVAVTDDLSVTAAYSYSDVTVLKSTDGNKGKHLSRVPAQLASAWMNYKVPFDPLQGLSVGLGTRYTGWAYGDGMNTFKVPSYTLYDAAVRYDLGKLDPNLKGVHISVNARNLADKYYVASCFFALACNVGEGRTVVAELGYKW